MTELEKELGKLRTLRDRLEDDGKEKALEQLQPRIDAITAKLDEAERRLAVERREHGLRSAA